MASAGITISRYNNALGRHLLHTTAYTELKLSLCVSQFRDIQALWVSICLQIPITHINTPLLEVSALCQLQCKFCKFGKYDHETDLLLYATSRSYLYL
jgi:hypothetical protein